MVNKTYQIDRNEMVFLAAMAGEDMMVGLDDPFAGWLAEQVVDEWKRIHLVMLEKGTIELQSSGLYAVEESLREAIRLCCQPDHWVALYNLNDLSRKTYMILHYQSQINHYTLLGSQNSNNFIILETGEREGSIGQQVIKLLQVSPTIPAKKRNLTIREDLLKTVMHQQECDEELIKKLTAAYPEQQAFIRTALAPDIKALITCSIQSQDQTPLRSWILIADQTDAWIIDVTDAAYPGNILVTDTDSDDMAERLDLVLHS